MKKHIHFVHYTFYSLLNISYFTFFSLTYDLNPIGALLEENDMTNMYSCRLIYSEMK